MTALLLNSMIESPWRNFGWKFSPESLAKSDLSIEDFTRFQFLSFLETLRRRFQFLSSPFVTFQCLRIENVFVVSLVFNLLQSNVVFSGRFRFYSSPFNSFRFLSLVFSFLLDSRLDFIICYFWISTPFTSFRLLQFDWKFTRQSTIKMLTIYRIFINGLFYAI